MLTSGKPAGSRILVVRLGAMGDILHTLPAAASLKHSHPGSHLTWLVEAKWAPLLAGNPFVDSVATLDRRTLGGLRRSLRDLRAHRYEIAVDFQGLIKSAIAATCARPSRIYGFHHTQVRERAAAFFYSNKTISRSVHVVDRNLDLAASAGATSLVRSFPMPPGRPEGVLPAGDFILASPLAGWRSKQWPAASYAELAALLHRDLGMPLVMNLPPGVEPPLLDGVVPHYSGLDGLIDATRRATAVVGVDSGPLHMAAALSKPGVALFGPTDPARNGPYGDSLRVLRSPSAITSYKRRDTIDESMRSISPSEVFDALRAVLRERRPEAGCTVR
jgi:heptosyltransferase I